MRLINWLASGTLVAAIAVTGCQGKLAHNLPPASRLMEPGPGVGGPGPGVITPPGQYPGGVGMMGAGMGAGMGPGGMSPGAMGGDCYGGVNMPGGMMDPHLQQASFCSGGDCYGGGGGACYGENGNGDGGNGSLCGIPGTSQIAFLGEDGVQVSWDVSGNCTFDSTPLVVPGRQDFNQGAIYRLKVTGLPQREAIALYPTLEVAPVTPRTDAYLAHAPIPIQFTAEDFDQVVAGNFVTKVVYLPDPEFQELALAGVETLVSTRLNPGEDPIAKADQRGSILAILRMGNKDLESATRTYGGNVIPAQYNDEGYADSGQYIEGEVADGGMYSGDYMGEGYMGQADQYGSYPSDGYVAGDCGPGYGGAFDGGYGNMPQGVPTAGFAPNAVPPHMIANMAPSYGMPITGTPIGLPGPPHIPLGVPAGFQSHTMTNRTRTHLPPPTKRMHISVKQRPGNDYPRPVDKVMVDEVNRAPAAIHGTVPGLIPSAVKSIKSAINSAAEQCDNGYCR